MTKSKRVHKDTGEDEGKRKDLPGSKRRDCGKREGDCKHSP
jgi:hypothetical protein